MLTPVARRSLPDAVFDQLAARIVRGDLAPGAALPSERELAETLGVNRGAVREGIQRLAQAGLVAVRHGGTTRVRDFRRTAGLDLLERLLVGADGTVDPVVVRSVLEMRAALAPEIARLAAERAPADLAGALDERVAAMRAAAGDLALLPGLSLDYWDLLVRATGNIAYELAFNGLRRTYEPVAPLLAGLLHRELADVTGYAELAAAVRAGAGAAAAAVAARLVGAGTADVLAALEPAAEPPAAALAPTAAALEPPAAALAPPAAEPPTAEPPTAVEEAS